MTQIWDNIGHSFKKHLKVRECTILFDTRFEIVCQCLTILNKNIWVIKQCVNNVLLFFVYIARKKYRTVSYLGIDMFWNSSSVVL